MATAFHAADFGFRPIRPEEAVEEGDEDMDVGAETRDPREGVSVNAEAAMETAGDEDLCFADAETLPDATGFGARQREINEKEHGKYLEQTERSFPGPFLGTTLRELCDSYADVAAQSATPTDVWADVVTTLRERERTACATVLDPATARHMKYRATLIEWILEVCADFGFGPTTADLAVQYMDRVLSKVNVPKTSLQLVAMCCLEVAVKYEEVEQDVPSLSKLRKCASNVYSVDIIRKMELAVLIELDWELSVVCSAHFLEAVLALTNGGTFPHDDIGDRQWTSACCTQLRKLCGFLHSICLQDGHVGTRHGTSPSRLAAAIVATARLQLGIYPVWPAELRAATGYNCDTLGPAMSSIMKLYKDSLPCSGNGAARDDLADARPAGRASDAYFETKADGWRERGDARDSPSGGSGGSLGSAATIMADAVVHGDGVLQGHQVDVSRGKYDAEFHREFLTPSPTGPLDAGPFFDEPFAAEEAPTA